MNQKHNHPGSHDHEHHPPAAGWKPHRDWRFWGVVLMLIAMVIYVLTREEAVRPGGGKGPEVPAAP
ncbi:hypothetical protein [Anatilimnocola floriformis]|uniref:hypothetical protein n=1 Tax=Anatilimnocola floriformis TaxID=2948575 RepID=UPI0020C28C68|nr:hypothetical protein [Anatilimnocola floriformis]